MPTEVSCVRHAPLNHHLYLQSAFSLNLIRQHSHTSLRKALTGFVSLRSRLEVPSHDSDFPLF